MIENLEKLSVYDIFAKTLSLDNPTLTRKRRKHGLDRYVISHNGLYRHDYRMDWLADHTAMVEKSVGASVSYKLNTSGIQLLADHLNAYIDTDVEHIVPSIMQIDRLQNRERHILNMLDMVRPLTKCYTSCRNCPLSRNRNRESTEFRCDVFGDSIPDKFKGAEELSCNLPVRYRAELSDIRKRLFNLRNPFTHEDAFFSQFRRYFDNRE